MFVFVFVVIAIVVFVFVFVIVFVVIMIVFEFIVVFVVIMIVVFVVIMIVVFVIIEFIVVFVVIMIFVFVFVSHHCVFVFIVPCHREMFLSIYQQHTLHNKSTMSTHDSPSSVGEIHMIVTTSPNYAHVYKYFEQSIMGHPGINVVECILDTDSFGHFRSDRWYQCCRQKIINFVEYLEAHPEIDYAIMSDADIQYFRPEGLSNLLQEARDGGLDYYGMREYSFDDYNTGFIIARNTDQVRQFFHKVVDLLANCKPAFADQTIINELLKDKACSLRHDKIPTEYTVFGGNWPVTKKTIFHHAVAALDEGKPAQLERVLQRFQKLISNDTM